MNIESLNLQEHPEGGRFREVHRSPNTFPLPDGRSRTALTHIYFHLARGEVSRFHRVEQEEVWNLYQGGPLRLWTLNEKDGVFHETILDAKSMSFCAVIPAGVWQATEPLEEDVLVGCSVAPGFEFDDFQLLNDTHPLTATVREAGLDRFI